MGKPAARKGDMHICPKVEPGPVPHVGGPIAQGSPDVNIGGLPAARAGDAAVCTGPPDKIAMGSASVFINYKPAARMGDSCEHSGTVIIGCSNVIIGDSGGPGAHPSDEPDAGIRAKQITPSNFNEVKQFLHHARERLENTGEYYPKYTQAELEQMVTQGTLDERFIVTLQKKRAPEGTVGFKRDSGRTTTWTTTFDQMERADSDPKLLCDLNGMIYDPDEDWELIVIDQGKYYQDDGGLTIIPNYKNTVELGKREFSKKYPPEQIEHVMSAEYSKEYAVIMEKYKRSGLEIYDKDDVKKFDKDNFSDTSKPNSDFRVRHEFTMEIGTNEHFSGDGLTKTTGKSGYVPKGQHGALETLTFEKKPATIAELEKSGAIIRIPAKPVK